MTFADPPLVSVVLPTYNRPDLLRVALKSVLDQSYRNIEVIVQDNAGARSAEPAVRSLPDPRVRLIRRPATVSQSENVISACLEARGPYLAILCDDDAWHPDFLATMVAPLERDPAVALTFCDHDIIGSDGRVDPATTEKITRAYQRHRIRAGVHCPFHDIALVYRAIPTLTGAVLRRSALDWRSIPLDMPFNLDLYLAYLYSCTDQACYYVPRRLAQIRYHSGSVSSIAQRGEPRIAIARNALSQWRRFAGDARLARQQSYFELKAGLNALAIVVGLLRSQGRAAALREFRRFWTDGLMRPRILFYHLYYAISLRRLRA
jgi:hypothetical protein